MYIVFNDGIQEIRIWLKSSVKSAVIHGSRGRRTQKSARHARTVTGRSLSRRNKMADYMIIDSPDAPWNDSGEPEMVECKECHEGVTPVSNLKPFVDSCADHLNMNTQIDRDILLDQYASNFEKLNKLKGELDKANQIICKMAETIAHLEIRNLKNKALFDEIYGLAQDAEKCLKVNK